MRYMLETSNLPKNQQKIHKLNVPSCDLEAYEKLRTIQLNIKQFVNEGTNLYIWSSQVGNGKTTWATKLLLQYFDSVWETCGYTKKGIFVNAPSYLANMKASISNPEINIAEIQSSLLKVPLAVIDEVVANKLSNYDYSNLYTFIDSRSFEGKSTIFTGNYSPNELEDMVGPQLRSRICRGTVIELKGRDMRNG